MFTATTDTWRQIRLVKIIPYLCAVVHLIAAFALAFALRGGSEVVTDPLERARYVVEHTLLWRIGWIIWMASAASLIAFYFWWASRLSFPGLAVAGVCIAACGMLFDLSGETIYAAWLPNLATEAIHDPGNMAEEAVVRFTRIQHLGTFLTAILANGLYTLGGILLTLKTSFNRSMSVVTWTIWICGAAMSISAIAGNTTGMVVSSTVLFPLFILWCPLMAWTLSHAPAATTVG
jgi:hypothetical protein